MIPHTPGLCGPVWSSSWIFLLHFSLRYRVRMSLSAFNICCLQSEPSSTGHVVCREMCFYHFDLKFKIGYLTGDQRPWRLFFYLAKCASSVHLQGCCACTLLALQVQILKRTSENALPDSEFCGIIWRSQKSSHTKHSCFASSNEVNVCAMSAFCCFGNSMRCCNILQSLQFEGVKLTAGILGIFSQADGG